MRQEFIRKLLTLLAVALAATTLLSAETPLPTPNLEQRSQALSQFISKRKFLAEGFYPGAMNEANRIRFEAEVNQLAGRLMRLPAAEQTKAKILDQFRPTMIGFENADSEERDRFLQYLEELMSIFDIESSDGMLNKWRYGFDPEESSESRNANALSAMSSEELELIKKFKDINASNAKATLLTVLGSPTSEAGSLQIWFLKPDASSAISLSNQAGVFVFSWLVKDRFMYSLRL